MSDNQPISKFLGMKILEIAPGYSKVGMKMKPEYQNFNGRVFGGIIVSLADEALTACVSSIAHPSIGTQLDIYFINSVEITDELIAEGRVIKNGKRLGFAEIIVTNQKGLVVAKTTATFIHITKTESK